MAPSNAMDQDLLNLHLSIGSNQPKQTLAGFSQKIALCANMEAVFSVLRQSLNGLIPYDLMAFYLCRGEHLLLQCLDGEDYRFFAAPEIPMGKGLSGWVAENRKAVINGNPAVEPGFQTDPNDLRSALSIPIESEEKSVGALSLYRLALDSFSPEDLNSLVQVGRLLALAFSKCATAREVALK